MEACSVTFCSKGNRLPRKRGQNKRDETSNEDVGYIVIDRELSINNMWQETRSAFNSTRHPIAPAVHLILIV
jgi:hypothetical protein